MKHPGAQLFLLAGLWLSLVAFAIGGSTLLPSGENMRDESPALLYKLALNEEIRRPNVTLGEGRSLVVDLRSMQLSLYENATHVQTFPILSIGQEGVFCQAPTGSYVVQTKELKHFSSAGGARMPYSIQFYDHFYIHGWPTDAGGTDVPTGYSGGCVRLSTSDAEMVYHFSSVGTKVFIVGGASRENFATTAEYSLRGDSSLPPISSQSFIIADIHQGSVLLEYGTQTKQNLGNLVSLITALAALETVDQYKKVHLSELLLDRATQRKYSVGSLDEIPSGALIYPLLFDKNDTAAKVFAREHGTKQFVKYMNEKVGTIGMGDTVFSGALSSDSSTTTAHDLFLLMQYVNEQKHFLLDVTLSYDRTLVDDVGVKRYVWENRNPWIVRKDADYRGGLAEVESDGSGSAMVLFELPLSEFDKHTIAFVVLDSRDIIGDVDILRAFVSKHFVYGINTPAALPLEKVDEPPSSSFFESMRKSFDLRGLLLEDIEYERDI